MVFTSISEAETLHRNESMTSTSTSSKSHPLHNFPMPYLKWSTNTANNHRCRKLADSAQKSPQHDSELRFTSPSRSDSESENRRRFPVFEGVKNGLSAAGSDVLIEKSEKQSTVPDRLIEKAEEKSTVSDVLSEKSEVRSKILIRLRPKNKSDDVAEEGTVMGGGGGEGEESAAKTWNLRPRRAAYKKSDANGGTLKIGGALLMEINKQPQLQQTTPSRTETTRLRNHPDAKIAETKEKKKKKLSITISLSRREIEEDIFAMTGSKPARRPKKRAKNVQKQLDCAFPGLWLAEITPDSYRVPDTPAKGR
ncbi:hypothetical protein L1049_019143 [Liquidambar formosana]|uniref:Uncharacterized protein n=1 Tax=Liquidambar formosana TaxID=63359 RepID=A0AAP0WN48_LIQFO